MERKDFKNGKKVDHWGIEKHCHAVMKYLAEELHPHHTVIITSNSFSLLESVVEKKDNRFILD